MPSRRLHITTASTSMIGCRRCAARMDRATWMRAGTCNDIQKQGRREAVELVLFERFTVIKFWMDETSSVALALNTVAPTYQVEDDEGRTHLSIHLPIEE